MSPARASSLCPRRTCLSAVQSCFTTGRHGSADWKRLNVLNVPNILVLVHHSARPLSTSFSTHHLFVPRLRFYTSRCSEIFELPWFSQSPTSSIKSCFYCSFYDQQVEPRFGFVGQQHHLQPAPTLQPAELHPLFSISSWEIKQWHK